MSTVSLSPDEIKALVRRFVDELYNKGNLAIVDEMLSPSFVDHTARPPTPPDRQAVIYDATMSRTAFPDLHVTIDDMLVEGNHVAVRTTMRGTHEGEFYGIPPTHKQTTTSGITQARFSDGKLVEWWSFGDELGWLQQLGAFAQLTASQQPSTTQKEVQA